MIPFEGEEENAPEQAARRQDEPSDTDSSRGLVLLKVPEEVPGIEGKVVTIGQGPHGGTPGMPYTYGGDEADREAGLLQPGAKIDILEPGGKELRVESTELTEHVRANEERGGGRLLHVDGFSSPPIEIAFSPKPRVPRPEPVHEEALPEEGSECREPSQLELLLSVTHQGGSDASPSGREKEFREEGLETLWSIEPLGVRVQKKDGVERSAFLQDGVVAGRAEADVLVQAEEGSGGEVREARGGVRGGVVDHRDTASPGNRGEEGAQVWLRVPGDDHDQRPLEGGGRTRRGSRTDGFGNQIARDRDG
jgi:hypothetical protein